MDTLVYVAGEPGIGKTTLMLALTGSCARARQDRPVPHDLLAAADEIAACEIGQQRGTYSGTDALGMNVHPAACTMLARTPLPPLVLAEGDRLATKTFLTTACEAGADVHLVHLVAPEQAAARRMRRGSTQNETWIRGRATKADRLATYVHQHPSMTLHQVLAEPAPLDLAHTVRQAIPALAALTGDTVRGA